MMDRGFDIKMFKNELSWLSSVIDYRIKSYFGQETDHTSLYDFPAPDLIENSCYAKIVNQFEMNFEERLILILALTPHLKPQLLDIFLLKNANYDKAYTEFGGAKGKNFSGFIPTGETIAFIISGDDLSGRLNTLSYFDDNHFFKKNGILSLIDCQNNEPILSGILNLSSEYLQLFCNGNLENSKFSPQFFANRIEPKLEWSDLVLDSQAYKQIEDITDWVKYNKALNSEWNFSKKMKKGYKALFYGMPGTGKTAATTLIGKSLGMDVYRINLSLLVSKYIGETEKNLNNILDSAINRNWILYFDEADTIFGKKTTTNNLNDFAYHQMVAFLMQRLEDFPGVIIFASYLTSNIDQTVLKNFQSTVYFTMPDIEMRLKLWMQFLDHGLAFEKAIKVEEIAKKYELTGGAITNVFRHCAIKSFKRNEKIILLNDLIEGIERELQKNK